VTLRAVLRQLEQSGRLRNFERAADRLDTAYEGKYYGDSDVYKWLEAAGWTLATDEDPELLSEVDRVVDLVCAAQKPDGYLNTYFSGSRSSERWTDLPKMHELYCAGHLIQAAIALRRATGKSRLFDAAVRFADLIDSVFGPDRKRGACGHPGVEVALVELARETDDRRYLNLALWFLDEHGRKPPVISGDAYHQDHQAFRDQRALTSHAVRALYLSCGAADIAIETGESALVSALNRLWTDLHRSRVYVTGGVGSRHEFEALGDEYELPNDRAYAETCAGIASAMWSWRMLQATGDARYADAYETAVYNAVLVGVSVTGDQFFYSNPLSDDGSHRRSTWFTTSCCPPNIARFVAAAPGMLYSTSESSIWLHAYVGSTARVEIDGRTVILRQKTDYPFDGAVSIEVESEPGPPFALLIRIPGWSEDSSLTLNGQNARIELIPGSYARLERHWEPGDRVTLNLPMPVRLVESNSRVTSNLGQTAIARGPLVYCVEQADHGGIDIRDLVLGEGMGWELLRGDALTPGVVALRTRAWHHNGRDDLYRTRWSTARLDAATLTAVPYFSCGAESSARARTQDTRTARAQRQAASHRSASCAAPSTPCRRAARTSGPPHRSYSGDYAPPHKSTSAPHTTPKPGCLSLNHTLS
jgi:DUF1680 family protein